MSGYTVVDAQRNQIGPVPESEVRKLLASGVINLDSLAWRPGMGGWEPLRAFSEFIDVPNPPEGSFNPYAPPMAVNLFPVTADGIDLNLPSSVRAQTLTHEILQRGYQLDIFSCIRRGWNLVFSGNFWEIIGVCALTGFTLVASSMCYASIVVTGPILGGLDLYFLKKIRGESSDLNTAFSGFSLAFSQLFLVYLIVALLGGVGFLCCVIPGIYLSIAWTFARTLVIDKKLDFWDAMECSRKVVMAHWFAALGLAIVGGLMMMMGVMALIIGALIAWPVYAAAHTFAYEDIFNPGRTPSREE